MPIDPVIYTLHEKRNAISEECDHDLEKICQLIKKQEQELIVAGWKLVSYPPKRPSKDEAA